MKIEIGMKYKIGDTVWAMKDNKPSQFEIESIKILIISDTIVGYAPKKNSQLLGILLESEFIVEQDCFLTKEDLIKSL